MLDQLDLKVIKELQGLEELKVELRLEVLLDQEDHKEQEVIKELLV